MFIFWGTRRVTSKLGVVADFCPICRGPQAFRLERIGMAGHVYGISVGSGQLAGFERSCTECGTRLNAEHGDYGDIAKRYPLDRIPAASQLSELIRTSNPHLLERYAKRIELEREIQRGETSLNSAERRQLIKEPFLVLAPGVERAFEETQIDLPLLLTIVAALALLAGLYALLDATLGKETRELLPVFMAGAGLIAFIAVLVQGALVKKRFLRRHFYPRLGRTLIPLRPQRAELDVVLGEIRQLGFALGKRTKPAELEPFLRSA
jgi:hypothetical protein